MHWLDSSLIKFWSSDQQLTRVSSVSHQPMFHIVIVWLLRQLQSTIAFESPPLEVLDGSSYWIPVIDCCNSWWKRLLSFWSFSTWKSDNWIEITKCICNEVIPYLTFRHWKRWNHRVKRAISFKTDVPLSNSINCNISLTRNNSDTSVSYFAKNECKYQYVH